MFLRFDAWTDPRIRDWIERNPNLLTPAAYKLFYEKRPEINVDVLRCAFELLTRVPLDRAMTVAAAEDYGVEARVGGRAKLQLDALGLDLPKLIETLAKYLHGIFDAFYRIGKEPSRELKLLFVHFASGGLKIQSGRHEYLNAEPDSAYFFAFSEFCIQAAQFDAPPSRAWWLKLGCLFAALQDVYCLRYHRKGKERRFSNYGDRWCDPSRVLNDEVMLRHVKSVRLRDGTIPKLVERVTWNAFWYFFDDVQDLSAAEERRREEKARATNRKVGITMRKLLQAREGSNHSGSASNSSSKRRR